MVVELGVPLNSIECDVDDSLGLILEEDVYATENVPSFRTSAMDGYAIKSEDLRVGINKLKVVAKVFAGQTFAGILQSGQAIRIMTGATVPEGADAVCPQEFVEISESLKDQVYIPTLLCANENIRFPGEDIESGQLLLSKGQQIGPSQIGILKSMGNTKIKVIPKVKVGVISTGDELTESGVLKPGQIRDSNRPTILASLKRLGVTPVDYGIVRDDLNAIEEAFSNAARDCDLILTTGGVSVGEADYISTVLNKICNGNMQSVKVAIKPAKPLAFGVTAQTGCPLISLPGNPVACLVSFHLFAKALIKKMMGHRVENIRTIRAKAGDDFERFPDGKLHLDRGILNVSNEGCLKVTRQAKQGSHMLRLFAESNVLICIPDGDGVVKGSSVDVIPLELNIFEEY